MRKHTQVYDRESNLITDINIEEPNFWTLLNKDNMTNALAISLVVLVVSLAYSVIRQPTTEIITPSKVSDSPVEIKVGEYDK
jgi:hypothetical protein